MTAAARGGSMEAGGIERPGGTAPGVGRQTDPTAGAMARLGWSPADPAPLGLAGFALTTFVLSMYNANLVSTAGEPVVLGLALAYGGIAQFAAGMWEFRNSNTFGATAFSSFGAFWLSFWALVVFYAKDLPPAHAGKDIGLYLIAWGIFTFYMWIASFRTTAAVNVVFLLLWITFILLGIGNANGHAGIVHAGGYVGLATALAAAYASFAGVINSTFGRVIAPVMPLGGPAAAEAPPR
jgi:succinate-acetate transporter protein